MFNREGVGSGTWCGMGAPPSPLKGCRRGGYWWGDGVYTPARRAGDLPVGGPRGRGAGHCDPVQGGGGGDVLTTSG